MLLFENDLIGHSGVGIFGVRLAFLPFCHMVKSEWAARPITRFKHKKPPYQHMADRSGLLFLFHETSGEAYCVPPARN
jgi:hypothetical protein